MAYSPGRSLLLPATESISEYWAKCWVYHGKAISLSTDIYIIYICYKTIKKGISYISGPLIQLSPKKPCLGIGNVGVLTQGEDKYVFTEVLLSDLPQALNTTFKETRVQASMQLHRLASKRVIIGL